LHGRDNLGDPQTHILEDNIEIDLRNVLCDNMVKDI